ncbi:MAG: xanthine dehydrogenase family protein molybdopterin-binding subunit [Azospirillaceae bacterium]
MAWIGRSTVRVEDERFLKGRATYTGDLTFPDMAFLAVVRSPVAHARIRTIDVAAAETAPGVLWVIQPRDLVRAGVGTFSNRIRYKGTDGKPMFETPRTLLAGERVRYVGEPIVAVVAESREAAVDAADAVILDFEEIPALANLEAALAPEATQIWQEAPGNIAFEHLLGDKEAADRAFANAAHITQLEMRISRVTAAPIEPRVAVAQPDVRRRRTTLYCATQTPHGLRTELASRILRVPSARLRVVALDVGGAFGMKSNDFAEYGLCVLAAERLDRAVKWTADRSEAFVSDHHARDNLWRAELALDAEQRFLGMRTESFANLGAYLAYAGTHQATNNVGGLAGVYRTPAMVARVCGVYTNTQSVSPYRGAGRPEATFVVERLVETAAAELGIDPVELRRRNLIQPDEMPFKTGLVFTYDCGDFPNLMERALAEGDWDGFSYRREVSEARGRLRGRGLAMAIEIAGGPPGTPFEEFASLTIDASGSAFARVGTHSHGQGHETAFRQILAEWLGLPPDWIDIAYGDTDEVPHGRGTYGSRSIGAAGAALAACRDEIINKAKRIAAHSLEADSDDVTFRDGAFVIDGTNRGMSLKDVAAAAYQPAMLPKDVEAGLSAAHIVSTKGPTFPNSAHVCEVEIDRETGVVSVERYRVVDDVGTVVNPLLLHGQIHGGVAQGIGQALLENVVHDGDGQLLSGSFQDYAMPRASDLPMISIDSQGVPTAMTPLGTKGAGEAGAVGALVAVTNAVCDALRPFGVVHLDPPITSEKVWCAMQSGNAPQAFNHQQERQ